MPGAHARTMVVYRRSSARSSRELEFSGDDTFDPFFDFAAVEMQDHRLVDIPPQCHDGFLLGTRHEPHVLPGANTIAGTMRLSAISSAPGSTEHPKYD